MENIKNKKSNVESPIGIIIIIIILGFFSFFVYLGYTKVIKTQEETIQNLQRQISEVQNPSSQLK
jgi:hypothetical protein